MICRNCGNHVPDNQYACDHCGTLTKQYQEATAASVLKKNLPMKWFKILIYFVLFATAALFVYEGINMLTGGQYDIPAVDVYEELPALRKLDIMYAAASFILAIFAIFARFSLAAYRTIGISALNLVYALNMALAMFYIVAIVLATKGRVVDTITMLYIPLDLSMIAVNSVYFKKREALFVN